MWKVRSCRWALDKCLDLRPFGTLLLSKGYHIILFTSHHLLVVILAKPKTKLIINPVNTAIFLLLVQTPSSRKPHINAPTGQKKPQMLPQNMSSNAVPSSSSTVVPSAPIVCMVCASVSSHLSSRRRSASPCGIVSGVCVFERCARKEARRVATSAALKPV